MTTLTNTLSPRKLTHGAGLAARITYPAFLLGNVGLVGGALAAGADPAAVAMPGLLGSLVTLFILERIMPFERSWQPSWKEGLRDFFYFGLNGAVDAGTKLGLALGVAALGSWSNGLPFWLALPLAILTADFAGYWLHRWGHAGWLWKVHGVHHTPNKVNTWNNNTIHFINSAYSGLGKTLPLMLLGFEPEVIVLAAYASTIQSYAVHANIRVELGRLGYFLMGPSHHRLHHSRVVAEAGNFASVTTLWDIVFGTFVYGTKPRAIGVEKPESFPSPLSVVKNQLHPFIDQGTH